ncbi:MAG: hypothetical protein ACFB2W_00645 [Leptolyngbyaceae cyanobacterium]
MDIGRVGKGVGIGVALIVAATIWAKVESVFNQVRSSTPQPESVAKLAEPSAPDSAPALFEPAAAATIEQQQQYIEQGAELVAQLNGLTQTAGEATDTPVVRVIVPRSGWNALSKNDQIAITYFIQDKIAEVRVSPKQLVTVSKDSPVYSLFVERLANLCGGCWAVMVSNADTPPYELSETVVKGDEAWQAGECCQGIRGSVFRKGI